MTSAKRILRAPLMLLVLICLLGGKKVGETQFDPALLDVKDGDVVFQHLPGKLGAVISDVTDSPLTHCGMIVHHNGEPHVIEAIGPVRYISLKKWLKQGDKGHFSQLRLKSVTDEQIAAAVKEAESLLGMPYDFQYELDDKKIYCSELVYKAYLRGAEIEVGEKEALGDLNWRNHETFIRFLAGGELPLERQMVTPVAIARNPRFKLMYSTFPARKDEPRYDVESLAGKWRGDYTIKDLVPVTATMEFDTRGKFVSGDIHLGDGTKVAIREMQIESFKAQREFRGRLRDSRDIDTDVEARIRDEGRRITGTWRDDHGHRGVFSFEKQSDEAR
ncbi:MAG: hypothetical protein HY290_31090 [Planctomycetia bacterium]|nr:hypothetical protein [Planctomycetia bacterium]